MHRIIILSFIASLCLSSEVLSLEGIDYDLTFAGYRIGMSFDEANTVKPFQSTEYINNNGQIVGYVENLMVDEIMMNLRVCFRNDKAYKLLSRFNPNKVSLLVRKYEEILGPPRVIIKKFSDRHNEKVLEIDYRWSFPDRVINIVSDSSNRDFATFGLVWKPFN